MTNRDAQTLFVVAALLLATAALLRLFVVETYTIPSSSMAPTLLPGDHVVAVSTGLPFAAGPERGDVIVFRVPDSSGHLAVKRVVALPGEHVELRGGALMIEGRVVDEPYLDDHGAIDHPPEIVPAGSYFVLGDRRSVSIDSRAWGAVSGESILATVEMVFWSSPGGLGLREIGADQLGEAAAPQRIRWERVFRQVR